MYQTRIRLELRPKQREKADSATPNQISGCKGRYCQGKGSRGKKWERKVRKKRENRKRVEEKWDYHLLALAV